MKGIIIYKSKYGSTKKYAEWLKEATGFEMVEADKAKIDEVAQCDTIIFGGGIYAGGIAGVNFLKKNIAKLKGKKIVAFCCGASPFDAGFVKALKERNFSGDLSGIPLYYCRGGYDLASMHFMDKTLCKLLGKSVAKKESEIIVSADHTEEFVKLLPYTLTNAQRRAIDDCINDITRKKTAMNRLIQGDVGSGKTMVAAACAYTCIREGYQVAMMAPTEILAAQHYDTFVHLFKDTDVRVKLLTGSMTAKQKRLMQAIDGINKRFGSNQIHFAIQGTEADQSEQPAGFMRPHKIEEK